MLPDLDRRIVAALQINGRAPWRLVAAAAGSTESTVARRALRLIDNGELRIAGLADPVRCGLGRTVLCRITCDPGSAQAVASGLALLPQARFAVTLAGGCDVVAELVVTSRADLARLLTDDLEPVPGVRGVETALVTRKFKVSYDWGRALLGEGAALIEPPDVDGGDSGAAPLLDDTDIQVMAALRANGRASAAEVACTAGITEATAHRRIHRLISEGCVICGALVPPEALGYEAQLLCWVRASTAHLSEVTAALAARPEVRFLAATTGPADLFCEFILPGYDDVYVFASETLRGLPDVRIETAVKLETMKRGFLPASELPVHPGTAWYRSPER